MKEVACIITVGAGAYFTFIALVHVLAPVFRG